MRILIAEDDQVLADGLMRSLRGSGAAVDHVANGSEADAAQGGRCVAAVEEGRVSWGQLLRERAGAAGARRVWNGVAAGAGQGLG